MAYKRHFLTFGALLIIGLGFAFLGSSVILREPPFDYAHGRQDDILRNASETPINSKKLRKTSQNYYSDQLETLGIKLRPGSAHRKDSKPTSSSERRCKSIVYKTLLSIPEDHRKELKELTLFYSEDGRRGLGGSGSVVLRCLNVTDLELSSVLVHEIGHLVDGGLLEGSVGESGFYDFSVPVFADDPSSFFYSISWESESEKKAETTDLDFVSLYATTDPFEDFAETYTYYRLHGAEFRSLASDNDALAAKYRFMKNYVFDEKEFGDLGRKVEIDEDKRHYDVTVLPIL